MALDNTNSDRPCLAFWTLFKTIRVKHYLSLISPITKHSSGYPALTWMSPGKAAKTPVGNPVDGHHPWVPLGSHEDCGLGSPGDPIIHEVEHVWVMRSTSQEQPTDIFRPGTDILFEEKVWINVVLFYFPMHRVAIDGQ